ncbi:MAG TPA: bifunctional DNA-formamidopyrimidine glycosylase/DNA-(apurinic or apyrimidinic site) lyase [Actinobacteria bacterium]|nr:bifunctional DNA-formamidopyrimidine glycosylase/DNA-(apurinic or apyrimidinic site) lyase [Actinomycetota bacterium]
MPELPEVETTRRLVAPHLVGRRIVDVEVRTPRVARRQGSPATLRRRAVGRRVRAVDRHGKNLLIRLSGGLAWVLHLGMSGRLALGDSPEERHVRLAVGLDDGGRLHLVDPRTFGWAAVWTTEELAAYRERLGPDALEAFPPPDLLRRRLRGRRAPIKALLLDQSIVAGLGNIYVDEALHRAGISPLRPGGSIGAPSLGRLRTAVATTLEAAIEAGGTSLEDLAYLLPDGRAGRFLMELAVYGRGGAPCRRCGETLTSARLRGRTTTWCPRCQT